MKPKDRLALLEQKFGSLSKIQVIKFGVELKSLSYCGDEYIRLPYELENDFIKRVLNIVKKNPKPNGYYIVGNIC